MCNILYEGMKWSISLFVMFDDKLEFLEDEDLELGLVWN